MKIRSDRRNDLVDVREVRQSARFEIRSADGDELTLEGYASTFEPYEMYGGPARGGWIEQLHRNAFDKTLRLGPDLHLLINHEGMPLARTKSGTLALSVDDGGLRVLATLSRSDPDVQRLEPKMRRGDMTEMSFAFRVKKQRWDYAPGFDDDPYGLRIIEEVSLHKGDVSVVNFGANPTTSAEILGKRKGKTVGGKKRTLSLAEAMAVSASGASPQAASPRRRGGTAAAAIRQVESDAAAQRARAVVSDSVVSRAEEILTRLGVSVSPPQRIPTPLVFPDAPHVQADFHRDATTGALVMPSQAALIAAGTKHAERLRRESALKELERQREAIETPRPTALGGEPLTHSIALKRD